MISDQDQHRVPQAYLRRFGYRTKAGQWKISALALEHLPNMLRRGLIYVNQKSIESITTERNLFDSDVNPGFEYGARDMEKMFSQLESHYPRILGVLESRGQLEHKDRITLVALLCSILIRAESMALRVGGSLEREGRDHYINELTRQMKPFNGRVFKHFLTYAKHKKNVLNLALLAKMENLYWLFFSYQMVFVHSLSGHGWWTTDDPVAYRYDMNDGKIFSDDTELCLPLSPKVLLYMHHKGSKVMDSPFRAFDDGTHVDATPEQFDNLSQQIVTNANRYIFFNDEFKFKGPAEDFPLRFE